MIQSEKLLGTKTYTLTVTTNPSSATCTLTYDGVSHSTKSAEVKAGTVISYSIYHSTYGTTSGTITMDSDKTLNCNGTYSTSSVDATWSQPTLSSNGTIGSGTLSVYATSYYMDYQPYKAFDKDASTFYACKAASVDDRKLNIYTSSAIKISSISFQNVNNIHSSSAYTSPWKLAIYAGSSYNTTLVSEYINTNTTASSWWTVPVNSSGYYNYHQISFTQYRSSTYKEVEVAEISINAKYKSTSYSYYWNKTIT